MGMGCEEGCLALVLGRDLSGGSLLGGEGGGGDGGRGGASAGM